MSSFVILSALLLHASVSDVFADSRDISTCAGNDTIHKIIFENCLGRHVFGEEKPPEVKEGDAPPRLLVKALTKLKGTAAKDTCDGYKAAYDCIDDALDGCNAASVLNVVCEMKNSTSPPPGGAPPPQGAPQDCDIEDKVSLEKADVTFLLDGLWRTHKFLCDNTQRNLKKILNNETFACIVSKLEIETAQKTLDNEKFYKNMEEKLMIKETDVEAMMWHGDVCKRITDFTMEGIEKPLGGKCADAEVVSDAIMEVVDHICRGAAAGLTSSLLLTVFITLLLTLWTSRKYTM